MNPAFNTINDGKEILNGYWLEKDYLSEMDNIKDGLKIIDQLTPEQISMDAVKLSIYLVNLGGLVAELTSQANESYMFRKFAYMWEWNSLSTLKGTRRDNEALDNTFKYHKTELINRFVADYMKEYKQDMERVLSSLQSRLRTLQSERIAGYMDEKIERNSR